MVTAILRRAARWSWAALATVGWLVVLGIASALPGRSGTVGFWLVVLVAAALALAAIWLPVLRTYAPVWADVQRYRRRRSRWLRRWNGYCFARDLGVVAKLPDEVESAAFQRKRRRWLPAVEFVKTKTSARLTVEQQTASATDDDILKRAHAAAGRIGMPPDHVTVKRPTPGRVVVRWDASAAVDPLATGRVNGWKVRVPGGFPVLGRESSGHDFMLDVPGDPFHLACQGASRSGKSVAMMGLLGGYASASRRGDVIIGGIDPTGLLLAPWAKHPGAEFRALGLSDLDAMTSALSAAVAEMDRRVAWLMSQGRDKVTTPSDFGALFFVLEEYPGLVAALGSADAPLKPAERRLPVVKAGVQRLIQEGAKAGVRVLLLAQRMDASIVGGSERSNIGTRISLRVDNRDAVTMLHPDADKETVERIRGFAPGYAYVERPAEAPQIVRFDAVDYGEYRQVVMDGAER